MGFQPSEADADSLFPKDVKMTASDFMSGIVFDDDTAPHELMDDDQTSAITAAASNNSSNYNTARKRTKDFFRRYIDDVYHGKEGIHCHFSPFFPSYRATLC